MKIISKDDKNRIVDAIIDSERKTSGEIKVHIEKKVTGDIYSEAEKKFNKLKMYKTKDRNGILIYIAFKNRSFCVLGDEGIHIKVGEKFWNDIIEEMQKFFKNDKFTDGIVHGIEFLADALAKYFPHDSDDVNELSDEVTIG